MLFKSLLSPIKSITSSLIDSNTSSASSSALAPLSLSTITNILSPTTVTNTISSITNDIDSNPLNTVTSIIGGGSGGLLSPITGIIGGDSGLLSPITGIIGGISGGGDGGLLSPITGIIGGIGSGDIGLLDPITGIIGGIAGGDGGPLGPITGIIGGITGGDIGNNPVTGVIQTGIDILQGVESLKTDLINTGINTVADAITGVFPQAEHPVSDLANLGTLTFETSRDTVNGTLEAISDLAGANFGGALGNATGVIGTLINNGSTAADIIQHIVGDDLLGGGILESIGGGIGGDGSPLDLITGIIGGIGGIGGDGSPLDLITGIIGGIGGIGGDGSPLDLITGIIGGISGIGGDGNPLDLITGIIGGIGGIGGDGNPLDLITGIIGGIGGGDGGSPLDILTGIIGGITGGDLGNNPVTGVIQTGIDILQGVESLKTDLINTGINTVANAILGVFPQGEHPISDLANLGTLTFETSRDTVNGTLEAISDLAGADFGGALGNATGVIGTLINNGSTASDIIQHIVGDDLLGGGILGSIGGIGGDGSPLDLITGIIGGIGGGIGGGDGSPLDLITGIIGGIGGIGGDGSPLDLITGIIGGIGGGDGGSPLDILTGIIGGITGGDLGNNPVTGVIQTGIDILQGVESLKTDLINTGINTVADAILGVFPQGEHPISDLANLGTLTFETSRDTVNGTLEAISDLAGADFSGAFGNATGVIDTLITNGSTAADIIQHIVGDDLLGGGMIGGIGGGNGSPLDSITEIISGCINGNVGGFISINGDSNSVVENILDSVVGATSSSSQSVSVTVFNSNFTESFNTPSLNLTEQLFESNNLF
ncbi:hypothetical protein [Acinetobacter haemolyticus]|uniref:hypothetical protein n=1 Tax=Acinetobacter haemolyticus TaxID=29430 RepID=UPI0013A549A1|nr:hypothetical protein [Acinetobacter haemolyticus]